MTIRRILVALDSSPNSLAALHAAAEMASLLEAEILGLFVEDINLLRLAELPFAHEVGFPSAVRNKLSGAVMERSLKVAAQEARQAMAAVAARVPVRWTFRVARGPVAAELLAASEEGDLIAFGKSGRKLGLRFDLGSTALGILKDASCTILLLPRVVTQDHPAVATVSSGASPESRRAAAIGTALARAWGGGLVTLIAPGETAWARRPKGRAPEPPAPGGIAAHVRRLGGATAAALIRAINEERAGALVMARAPSFLGDAGFRDLVEKTGCRVLLAARVS